MFCVCWLGLVFSVICVIFAVTKCDEWTTSLRLLIKMFHINKQFYTALVPLLTWIISKLCDTDVQCKNILLLWFKIHFPYKYAISICIILPCRNVSDQWDHRKLSTKNSGKILPSFKNLVSHFSIGESKRKKYVFHLLRLLEDFDAPHRTNYRCQLFYYFLYSLSNDLEGFCITLWPPRPFHYSDDTGGAAHSCAAGHTTYDKKGWHHQSTPTLITI